MKKDPITIETVLSARMREVLHWRIQILMLNQVLHSVEHASSYNNDHARACQPLLLYLHQKLNDAQHSLLRMSLLNKHAPEARFAFQQAMTQVFKSNREIMSLLDPTGGTIHSYSVRERDELRGVLRAAAHEWLTVDDLVDVLRQLENDPSP
jgi:hypothetical protein